MRYLWALGIPLKRLRDLHGIQMPSGLEDVSILTRFFFYLDEISALNFVRNINVDKCKTIFSTLCTQSTPELSVNKESISE
jgi:hypothetical protein